MDAFKPKCAYKARAYTKKSVYAELGMSNVKHRGTY